MKKGIIPVSLTRALLITYLFLFVGLIFTRYYEHKQTQRSSGLLFELGHSSMQRQLILADLVRNSDYVRVNFLTALYCSEEERRDNASGKIASVEREITDALQTYHPFISDEVEREMFNQVFRLEHLMTTRRRAITSVLSRGELREARLKDIAELEPVYEQFHEANNRLSQYVDQRDGNQVHTIQDHFDSAVSLGSKISLVILTLMGLLGVFILFAVRTIIKKKSLLEKSEKRFRALVEQTHDLVATVNMKGYIEFANTKLKSLLGYSDEDLRTMPIHKMMHESSSEIAVENFRKGPEGGLDRNFSRVFLNKDGDRIYLEGSMVWEYQNGKVNGATIFYKNVTEEQLLEEELRESERKFKQLFNMSPVPMYIIDPSSYELLQVNDMASRDTSFEGTDYLQKSIMEFVPKQSREWAAQSIRRLVNSDPFFKGSFNYNDANGNIVELEIHGSHFMLKKRPVIMVAIVDVTERKQQENRITKAIIKTQEEERYEIGSELHDNVCQILASAKMSMGLMKKTMSCVKEEYYENTISAINLATEEIRNLSHRLAPVFFRNSNFEEAVVRLLNTFTAGITHDVSLYFDDALENYPMTMELQLNLYRILQEQLRNIFKYAKATKISIEVLLHNSKLHMRISDNGVGFEKSTVSSGIGMANMQRRTEFFSGKMEVNTAPGEGCEVLISIPMEMGREN